MILHPLIQLSNENYGLSCQKKTTNNSQLCILPMLKLKGLLSLLSWNSQDGNLCLCYCFFRNIEGIDFSV